MSVTLSGLAIYLRNLPGPPLAKARFSPGYNIAGLQPYCRAIAHCWIRWRTTAALGGGATGPPNRPPL